MCNGGSNRPSIGGSIVVLKPVDQPGTPNLKRELFLRLIDDNGDGRTQAAINGLEEGETIPDSEIFIHKDGDLRLKSTSDSSILYRLKLPKDIRPGDAFETREKINLTVGGDGVIGRRVSLMSRENCLAVGIIGWN